MKKALAIVGILALSITPTASFADHLETKEGEIRPGGNLAHANLRFRTLRDRNLSGTNLRGANLLRADLRGAILDNANLGGINATNLKACPSSLPSGWVCENNSLIQR